MKKFIGVIILSFMVLSQSSKIVQAADNQAVTAVQQEVSKRAGVAGTLDIFDEKLNKVRNLKVMDIKKEVTQGPDGYTVMLDARDGARGDDVSIQAKVKESNGVLAVTEFKLDKVIEKKTDFNKEFSDVEIQSLMNDYLQTQAKFTGHLMLYDEDNKKMRNLDLVKLDPTVRRLGVLYISRAEYKDADSKETVGMDITVENKNGQLNVQSLRIREVKK